MKTAAARANTTAANLPSGNTIDIPAGGPPYAAGARVLAALAHPPVAGQQLAWRKTDRAFCRLCLAAQEDLSDGWSTRPQQVVPDHLGMTRIDAENHIEDTRKLLDERLGAAHVIMPFLRVAERDGLSSRRGRGLTIDAEVQRTILHEQRRDDWLQSRGISTPSRFPQSIGNFETRVVRASRPVIHIAVAVALAIDRSQKTCRNLSDADRAGFPVDFGGPQMSVANILLSPVIALWIVRVSQFYEDLVLSLPMRTLKPVSMVRLRVVGD